MKKRDLLREIEDLQRRVQDLEARPIYVSPPIYTPPPYLPPIRYPLWDDRTTVAPTSLGGWVYN